MSKKWRARNINDLLHYNALDTVATARAYADMVQEKEWKDDRVQNLWKVHTKLAKIAAKMHDRGFKINEGKRRYLSRKLKALHEERKQIHLAQVNDAEYSATPDDMRGLLYKRHAIDGRRSFNLPDPPEYQKEMWVRKDFNSGKCAVDKGALLKLYVDASLPEELHEIIRSYWEQAAPRKARSTYVSGAKVRNAIGKDGRLRPGWNSCGTETMRWSCSNPNLMNLSEDKDDDALIGKLPNMRRMYEAADGHVLVHADVSQQELRFMAVIANDKTLQHALTQKNDKGETDVYTYDARQIFKLGENEPVKKDARKQIKIVHLAFQYAASTPTVYVQALVKDRALKYSECKLFHNKLKQIYHGTVSYWEQELQRVCESGLYSEGLLLGTRVYYPSPPAITETANKPIQTSAGESMALAMIMVDEELQREGLAKYNAGIVNILHDALDIECPEDVHVVDEVKAILKEKMAGPWVLNYDRGTVHTPVDIKVNKNWGKV